jgi:pSer/pThr/pTyr-binding forkhead associated (FHA) protein/uncharacterized coiled-coil DUF342 family protein
MGLLKAKRNGQMVAYRLDKAAVIVGSGESCNIRVPDAGLVSRHCQILKMENGYVLRDMSGDAGTFVNGKKVKEHLLSDRDLIQVGKERFTFSVSAGENTSRVAVSVAPPPAAAPATHGNTSRRVAAVPPAAAPAKGNTGRIAAAPPKTDRVERGTGRIAAQPSAKTTGRTQKVTGGTKKITARTAAAMGYQTSRSTFAMPSTPKGKMIAVGAVVAVLAIGGIFYAIASSQIKPEEIKAEMAKKIKDMEKFKDKPIELDDEVHRFLNEYEPVKKHVMSIYAKIEKDHGAVHITAENLRKATKEVQPFFNKFAAAKVKPDDFKAQAQSLYDECRSLVDSHGGTVHGDKLREMQNELKGILEQAGPDWPSKIVPLQGEVRSAAKKGDFVGANKLIDDFGKEFNEKEKLDLFKRLTEQRDFLKRESMAHVNREIVKAQKEIADGSVKKEEVKKRLEGFKAGLEGYKEALEKLENHILTIK